MMTTLLPRIKVPRLLILWGLILLAGHLGLSSEGAKRFTHLPALDFFRSRVCQTYDLDGYVGDCGCDFETVNAANRQHFQPFLADLVKRTFFRYFKVNLNKGCPFWHEEMMCSIRDCEVVECEASEVPPVWIEQDTEGRTVRECVIGDSGTSISEIERKLGQVDRKGAKVGDCFDPWAEADNSAVWIEQKDEEKGMTYINLMRNPERFTGYSGPSARRVWKSTYENCFEIQPADADADQCFEKRIFYRLIAGLQSSISTHLSLEYYDQEKNKWCPNTQLYVEKVGKHPERIDNLYFTYLFMMRAIKKAGSELIEYDYNTGHPEDDDVVRNAIKALIRSSNSTPEASVVANGASENDFDSLVPKCQRGFNESNMFQPKRNNLTLNTYLNGGREEEDMHQLRHEFFVKFHNISRIMDCVGCEKCRLWGKLQVLGLGTAIKILLGMPEDKVEGRFSFQRNEVIALINTAHQLAKSVKAVDDFQKLEFDEILSKWMYMGGIFLVALGLLLGLCARKRLGQQAQGNSSSSKGSDDKKKGNFRHAAAAGEVEKRRRKARKAD